MARTAAPHQPVARRALAWPRALDTRLIGITAVVTGLGVGLLLLFRHTVLGGPGDQITYHEQAARLIPFTDNYYGPSYFVALRLVHDAGLDWFTSGKVLGFASACCFLLLCYQLFRRILPESTAWLALALVALNPELISSSYSTLTILYGAAWVLVPIVLLAGLSTEQRRGWLLAGLLFGLAALARFQSLAFLLGAALGTLFLIAPLRERLRSAALLVAGAVLPLMAWTALLLLVQGFVPQNYNFVHLTTPLGEFETFHEIGAIVEKYGSVWGVITADPLNLPRILVFSLGQLARFPLREGVDLLGVGVLWLLPGTLVALFRRDSYTPWLIAFVAGLLLTGTAARGWLWYYVPILPLFAYLVTLGVDALSRGRSRAFTAIAWGTVLVGALGWAAVRVPRSFADTNWAEWGTVRAYLDRHHDPSMVVSSTSGAMPYGGRFRFVDYDSVMYGRDLPTFVDSLRRRGITHVVVEERHMIPGYPSLARLVADSVPLLPPGLVRDTLVVHPRRAAVYRVLPAAASPGRDR
jgi:hypothetical protein